MRDPVGAGLSPDPLGLHAEALGELVGCQESVHIDAVGFGAGETGRRGGGEGVLLVVMIERVWTRHY